MRKIIAVDFDGTLFASDYPEILRPIDTVIRWCRKKKNEGCCLILWTCREGEALEEAVDACRSVGLEFDYINQNAPEIIELHGGSDCRKIYADIYLDDHAIDVDSIAYPLPF